MAASRARFSPRPLEIGPLLCVLLILTAPAAGYTVPAALQALIDSKVEAVRAFAAKIETAYEGRCSSNTECSCSMEGCQSPFVGSTCDEEFDNAECSCRGLLLDHTHSVVRIPSGTETGPTLQPKTDELKEAICYSQTLDRDFKANREAASYNGMFRLWPGRPWDPYKNNRGCNAYDPRLRPWFVAASSGPKDVVLVLDVSTSMQNEGRLELMKDAAKSVLSTLTISDYFGVVWFESAGGNLPDHTHMLRGTKENIDSIKANIDGLTAGGATNFQAGFNQAFELMRNSRPPINEHTSGCHTAILFLTDGMDTSTASPETIKAMEDAQQKAAVVFTYSLGVGADQNLVHDIACAHNGIWQPIMDGGDLRGQMSLYYDYFSAGLANSSTHGDSFVFWVEPYEYATGGVIGTSVSAPVYDRSRSPPVFLGVVGAGLRVSKMEALVDNPEDLVAALVQETQVQCADIQLSECQLQALRAQRSGESACPGQCTGKPLADLRPQVCPGQTFPANMWCGPLVPPMDLCYGTRACCSGCDPITSSTPEKVCNPGKLAVAIAVPIGSVIVIATTVYYVRVVRRRQTEVANAPRRGRIPPPPRDAAPGAYYT